MALRPTCVVGRRRSLTTSPILLLLASLMSLLRATDTTTYIAASPEVHSTSLTQGGLAGPFRSRRLFTADDDADADDEAPQDPQEVTAQAAEGPDGPAEADEEAAEDGAAEAAGKAEAQGAVGVRHAEEVGARRVPGAEVSSHRTAAPQAAGQASKPGIRAQLSRTRVEGSPKKGKKKSPEGAGGDTSDRAITASTLLASLAEEEVPHMDECGSCDRCLDGHHGFDPDLEYPLHVRLPDPEPEGGSAEGGWAAAAAGGGADAGRRLLQHPQRGLSGYSRQLNRKSRAHRGGVSVLGPRGSPGGGGGPLRLDSLTSKQRQKKMADLQARDQGLGGAGRGRGGPGRPLRPSARVAPALTTKQARLHRGAKARAAALQRMDKQDKGWDPVVYRGDQPLPVSFKDSGTYADVAPPSITAPGEQPGRHCPVCRGCSTRLIKMVRTKAWLGSNFTMEVGASQASVFRVYSSRAPSGLAVVKLFCLPKKHQSGKAMEVTCPEKQRKKYARTVEKMVAMQALADFCGLTRVNAASWTEKVKSVMPGTGIKVEAYGIFSELAEGVSMALLTEGGHPRVNASAMLRAIDAIPSDQLQEAAVFDMLTSQCDRHPQNIFVAPDGTLKLIDNDQGFADAWRPSVLDSVFLPRTQKHEIARAGWGATMRKGAAGLRNPQVTLDYRCHVRGGAMGPMYPPKVASCLAELRGMTVKDVMAKFGMSYPKWAQSILMRARYMSRSFEEAIDQAASTQKKIAYELKPPCCRVGVDNGKSRGAAASFVCTSNQTRVEDKSLGKGKRVGFNAGR